MQPGMPPPKAAPDAGQGASPGAAAPAQECSADRDRRIMKELVERPSRLELIAEGACTEVMAEVEWVEKTNRVAMLEAGRRQRDRQRAEERDGRSRARSCPAQSRWRWWKDLEAE